MSKQVYNPYLPLYEYVPDGEPHVFNGRVYVYGSHDQFGAFQFCHNDYITWSAPIDNLKDWRYEGVILARTEDPDNKKNKRDLYAPDVCQGPDGKYYIYYAYDWLGHTGVAVSDSPAGPFKFHGHVGFPDGSILGHRKGDAFQFDPGVLVDDDGRVYLYSGFGEPSGAGFFFLRLFSGGVFDTKHKAEGGFVMELEPDMKTIKAGPFKIFDKRGMASDEWKGHEFFEASSIRKVGNKYYFVYSSAEGHELCYATSDSPMGPFKFGGVIISNGDVGLNGRKKEEACYPLGNNHGGMVNANGKWYIFYHRHTNWTNTDRQGMAEEIKIEEDGSIKQVEMTSCGLNGGPLEGKGVYPASICCCLMPKEGNIFYPFSKSAITANNKTFITQSGKDTDKEETQYIKNVQEGCLIGWKYFDLTNTSSIKLTLKGDAAGQLAIRYEEKGEDGEPVTFFNDDADKKFEVELPIDNKNAKSGLYIYVKGCKGKFDFFSFELK